MTLSDRIQRLAEAKGISQSELEKTLGFGKGTITKWKGSTIPSADKLLKIADYFEVTIDYLMTGKEEGSKNATELTSKDERDIAKDLSIIMKKLKSGESGPASYDGNEIPEETQELFAQQLDIMLHHLKKINKEKYNPYKNKK